MIIIILGIIGIVCLSRSLLKKASWGPPPDIPNYPPPPLPPDPSINPHRPHRW
jgi:hypothetical protein